MANATKTQLQELYLAYFGRPGDPTGLDYWLGLGISREEFAEKLYFSNEYQNLNKKKSIAFQVNLLHFLQFF